MFIENCCERTMMPQFAWSHGAAEVVETAGMLRWAAFDLPAADGGSPRRVLPFAPPLTRDPHETGHLAVLGGEFLALPFGSAPGPDGATGGWERFADVPTPSPAHGVAGEDDWVIERDEAGGLVLALDVDVDDDAVVARIERTVRGVDGEPAIEFTTTIHARAAGRVPIGIHPVLRLPERPGALRLVVDAQRGFTAPGRIDPGATVTRPDSPFRDLATVPARGDRPGETVDLTALPLGGRVDDIVLLTGVRSPIVAEYVDDEYAVELSWDDGVLPSVLLWISDGGLADVPWNGVYRGLGVEPVAAAFDLPPAVSISANPLNAIGVPTSVAIDPGVPLRIASRISLRPGGTS
jgi:hypothetical protein